MPDIDQIALEVARRFTKDGDPQGSAQLQVAIAEAIRASQPTFPLVDLLDIRNQLHVMATTVVPNFCDMAAALQGKVQQLIDDHRRAHPEERS